MPAPAEQYEITPQQRRRSVHLIFISSVLSIFVMYGLSGTVVSLFAIKLGAAEFSLGLIAFLALAPSPVRVLAMNTIERIGKRKVMLYGYTAALILSVPFLILPVLAQRGPENYRLCLILLLLTVFLRAVPMQWGIAGWFPFIQDIIDPKSTGRFFANLRTCWQSAALLCLLGAAWYVGRDATWGRFEVVFMIGILAQVLRVFTHVPISERPPQGDRHRPTPIKQRFLDVWRSRGYRALIVYILFYTIAFAAPMPFFVKMLKDLGFSDGLILAASAMTPAGAIISLRLWGRLADRYGNRSIFSISHVGMIVITLLWLLVDEGRFGGFLAFALYFLASVFHSGNGIAQTRYLLHAVPNDQQNHINVINMISFAVVAVAPLLAGLFLRLTTGVIFQSGALTLNNYHLLYVICAVLFVPAHMLRRRLGTRKETPTIRVLALVTTSIRGLFAPFWPLNNRDPE